MTHSRPTFDCDLQKRHIQDLTDAGAVARFFEILGYPDVDPIPQTAENLGIVQSTADQLEHIELIAGQPGELQVYLFELRSVTVNHRKALVRAIKDRAGKFLLVVTTPDYERLDFVLLDTPREEWEAKDSEGSPPRPTTVKVLPRVYSVERANPEMPLAVRVLRRFTWTESDPYAQHEKLRSAFELATWSEPEFNNRALFSDHYLKNRLPDLADDWADDPKPAYQALSRLFRNARGRLGQSPRPALRRNLLDPALEVLGFRAGDELDDEPEGEVFGGRPLYAAGDSTAEAPLALCLDFPWERSLDAKDPQRDNETPELNPSVLAVRSLEDERVDVPWVILTNGQIWRLYGRQAHSRATNYYEIDAEEVVSAEGYAAADPQDPFRYFWLLFRRQAFEPRTFRRQGRQVEESLLTHVWVESGEYAKDLGDRLKARVFDQVFEILARGFLASRTTADPPTQEELDEAFEGTLTFLYRVLFLLYAEARDLLPVRDPRGYYEVSLSKLRKEIGENAGPALSQTGQRLAEAYSTGSSRTLYERLLKLFTIIDRGKPSINVPKYNGGLFLTEPEPDDDRAEARAARFLETHPLEDLPLARALDLLARDEDQKTHELGPVDYKSLGVRQLGSIYEGLLEFRLRLADEPMAVVQAAGKKKHVDQVVRLAKAREKRMKIRRTGRSKEAPEKVFDTGEIYLENDKRERQATGSYYTPDFVVEYIIRKTLQPILGEKLEALRPRLREAEAWRRKRKKQAGDPRSRERASKYDFGPAVEHRWRKVIDDAFDLKVLDPAMGSGHFLVEAVDFITDEILRFLSAFPWNPVFAHLQHLRRTILEEMESQGIAIDPERLTDTHLLKRHVLKRCIFGVDLNPMAVELAKVSLWLDCFTLGAPLSFLEHHLRRGNSLLGVSVDEARRVIEQQFSLLGSRFAGIQLATLSMIQVSGMPDVTAGQLTASRETFREGSQALAPYLRLLHFFLAHVLRVTAKGKSVESSSVLLELIRARETEELFSDRSVEAALNRLSEEDRQLAERVLAEARERGFFHWHLEFPEAFFRIRGAEQRQIELDPEGGFDAVVGNPPWIRQEGLKDLKPVLKVLFEKTYHATADVYVYILTRGVQVLRPGGRLGMILQNKWFKTNYGEALRIHLASDVTPLEVIDFGHAPLFDADTFPCILRVWKNPPPDAKDTSVSFFDVEDLHREEFPGLDLDEYGKGRRGPVFLRRLRPEGWELLPEEQGDLMEKLREAGPTLAEYLGPGQAPQYGIKTGYNDAFLIDQETRDRLVDEDPDCEGVIKPYLRGQDIERWVPCWEGQWMIRLASSQNWSWPWAHAKSEEEAEKTFRATYPALHRHMKDSKPQLRKRQDRGKYWWELRSCDYYEIFDQAKIIYKDAAHHSSAALDETGLHAINTCYMIPGGRPFLLACLNSSTAWYFFHHAAQKGKTDTFRLFTQHVEQLPIPEPSPEQSEELTELVKTLCRLKSELCGGEVANPAASAAGEPESTDRSTAMWQAELDLHHAVFDLYGLTPAEVDLLQRTAPPRDPLLLAKQKLAAFKREELKAR